MASSVTPFCPATLKQCFRGAVD